MSSLARSLQGAPLGLLGDQERKALPAVGTVGLGAMPKTKEWLPSLDLGSSSTSKKPGVAVPQYVTRATAGITGTVASVRETAETAQGKDTCFPGLTLKQRIQGCVACFCVGIIISILSFISFWAGNLGAFGTLYTFGNIVSLCSTMFLMGPKRQLRNMTRANRRMATGVYIVAMIVTLSLAFTGAPGIVVIISCLFRARATTGRPNARTSSLSLWRSARRAPSWPVPI
jgi:hypothetical protein